MKFAEILQLIFARGDEKYSSLILDITHHWLNHPASQMSRTILVLVSLPSGWYIDKGTALYFELSSNEVTWCSPQVWAAFEKRRWYYSFGHQQFTFLICKVKICLSAMFYLGTRSTSVSTLIIITKGSSKNEHCVQEKYLPEYGRTFVCICKFMWCWSKLAI